MSLFQVLGNFCTGGVGRAAAGLAQALTQKGLSTTCVAIRQGGTACLSRADLRSVDLGVDGRPHALLRGLCRFRSLYNVAQPDVVHIHGPSALLFVRLALLGIRPAPRIWFTWHDSGNVLESGRVWRGLVTRCLSRCERVFGSSRNVAARLQRSLSRRCRATVFRNGVAELPETLGRLSITPTILWAARFVPPKDPEIVLRAAATLRNEGLAFRLAMIGNALPHLGWFFDRSVQLSKDLGIADVVDFPGWVDDMRPYYAMAAVGVQSSHTEGLSMALLEQMMAGLAIVATDVGDTDVAIRNNASGILIQAQDEGALTCALRTVLTDVQLRARLGREARLTARASFSLDAVADRAMSWL